MKSCHTVLTKARRHNRSDGGDAPHAALRS